MVVMRSLTPELPHRIFAIVWICILALSSVAGADSPPTLDVEDAWVHEYSEGGNVPLDITCVGDRPLTWEVIHVHSDYYKITHTQEGSKYKSTFKISEPHFEDTGNFTCCYDVISNGSCLERPENVVRTYVYVYDGKNPFIKGRSNAIMAKIGNTISLDCRTTHPNITVELFKEGKNVTDEFEVSPFYVFSKEAEYLQDSGLYICREDLFSKEIQWHVTVEPAELPLHRPNIKEHENAYHVVGLELQMNCSIPFFKEGLHLIWDLPNPNTNYTTSEFTEDHVAKTKISSLLIASPTLEDSGNYSCTARQGNQRKTTTYQVNIKTHLDSFVDIEKPPRILSIQEGHDFKWISNVQVYPKNPVYKFFDPLNKVLEEDHRISTDFIYDSGQLTLRIDNVRAEDFGQYKVLVGTNDGLANDTQSVIMFVNATPKVEIEKPQPYYSVGQEVDLKASILSYGIRNHEPSVAWWFVPDCETSGNGQTCSSEPERQELNSTVKPAGGPKNRWESQVTFAALSSGFIYCGVECEYGANVSSVQIIVSDIKGKFVFRLISESGSQGIYSTDALIDVIEGDQIEFECAGLTLLYDSISLIPESPEQASQLMNCSGELSIGDCLTIPEVTSDADGEYTCQGTHKSSGRKESRSVTMNVKEMKPLTLVKSLSNVSLSGKDITVEVQSPFSLSCIVEGRPEPVIHWLKDGVDVESIPDFVDGDSVLLLDWNKKLEFKFARSEYEGLYTCQAASRVGEISPFATLAVDDNRALYVGIICGAVGFIVLLIGVVGYLVYRVSKEKEQRRELRRNQFLLFEQGNVGDLNPDCLLDEQAHLLPYDRSYEIGRDRVHLGKHLGGGAFGQVILAEVDDLLEQGKRTRVALKMCKETKDEAQLNALTVELKIMIHLGKHLNIVRLMGACTTDYAKGQMWVLLEYCKYGNLLKYIHKNKRRFVDQIDHDTGFIDHNLHLIPRYSSSSNQQSDLELHAETRSRTPSSPTRPIPPIHEEPLNESFSTLSDGSTNPRKPFYAENPHYGEMPYRQNSLSESLPGNPAIVINPDGSSFQYITSEKFIANLSKRHPSTASSTQGSEIGGLRTVNTDMTRVTTPGPISTSEVFYDTQGNTFAFVETDAGRPFSTSTLISWAWQIANGMEYLSSRKVLHGDLAARNILLCEDNVVKICDFGLSRDLYKKDVYTKKNDGAMPIKWMALEAIQDRIFSTQSDVWAYGVTLWELFTLGNTPYPEVQVDRDFVLSLEQGRRMEKPKYCNEEIYDLMLQCWSKEPMKRPTFSQIQEKISPMMDEDTQMNYVTMNAGFDDQNQQWFRERVDYVQRVMSPEFSRIQDQIPEDIIYQAMHSHLPQGNHIIIPVTQVSSEHYLPMNPGTTPPAALIFSPRPYQMEQNQVFTFNPNTIPVTSKEGQSPASPETVKLLEMQVSHVPRNANNNVSSLETRETKNLGVLDSPHIVPPETGGSRPSPSPSRDSGKASYQNVPSENPPYVMAAGFM